jgi:hypothetical protein
MKLTKELMKLASDKKVLTFSNEGDVILVSKIAEEVLFERADGTLTINGNDIDYDVDCSDIIFPWDTREAETDQQTEKFITDYLNNSLPEWPKTKTPDFGNIFNWID